MPFRIRFEPQIVTDSHSGVCSPQDNARWETLLSCQEGSEPGLGILRFCT